MAGRYGVNIRYQAGYNKVIKTVDFALSVDIPETKALGRRTLDPQRLMESAIHMTDRKLLSIETAAQKAFPIDEWVLRIDSMHEGNTVLFRDSVWTRLKPITISKLDTWRNINSDWTNVVGIGTYTTILYAE